MTLPAGRQLISSGAPWESSVGYSRAVRIGRQIFVAGTTAVDERGDVIGAGDPYLQTKAIIAKIQAALVKAGSDLGDIVRTRMFVTDMGFADQVGRAHGEAFAHVRPASTLVQVVRLIDPRLLVEIEADAVTSA